MKTIKPVIHQNQSNAISDLDAINRLQSTNWIIDGIIPRSSITWLYGAPKSGKSFVALDMAAAIGTGQKWMNRDAELGIVLYLAAEGGDDVALRKIVADSVRGKPSAVKVHHAMPQIDTDEGLEYVLALLYAITGWCISDECPEIHYEGYRLRDRTISKVLTPELKSKINYEECGIPSPDEDDFKFFNNPDQTFNDFMRSLEQLTGFDAEIFKLTESDNKETASVYDAIDSLIRSQANLTDEQKKLPRHEIRDIEDQFIMERPVVLFIDTYSYTARDDEKATVSAYTRNLRRLMELCGGRLSIVVVDHTTKSGNSYMGSVAKEGNSDVMIEVEKEGTITSLYCRALRQSREFDPIHLNLQPVALDGYHDTKGRPLSSLYPYDGMKAQKLAAIAGGSGTAASIILNRLSDAGGQVSYAELKDDFISEWIRAKPETKTTSATQAFRRSINALLDDEIIIENDDKTISLMDE